MNKLAFVLVTAALSSCCFGQESNKERGGAVNNNDVHLVGNHFVSILPGKRQLRLTFS